MKVAYLDCCRGISGVTSLAALIDAGAEVDSLSKELEFLGRDLPVMRTDSVVIEGFRVRRVSVEGGGAPVGRRLADLEAVLSAGGLPDAVRDLALRIYGRIAEAEARVHGSTPDAVRFHEIGSLRSVVGVVGTALAIEQLGIDKVVASPLPFGRGLVDTEHGRLAVPTPATLELMRGMPVEPQEVSGEIVTPTGAAIVAIAAASFGQIPSMTIDAVGCGTDDLRSPGIVLRVIVGRERNPVRRPRTA
jgi:pyridinium-3,5-bisthiocarboxylic acid mononucleotide nickel chelatase